MGKNNDPIVIAMCSDDRGADFMQVAIKSIFINNKDEDIELHLITDGFSEKTLKGLSRLEKHFNRKIEVHIIDVSMFDNIPGAGDGFEFPKGTLFRFCVPSELIGKSKALYLDTDIVVEKSLREFWNIDLGANAIAAVNEHADVTGCGPHILGLLGFNVGEYINAGVMLMNLDYFRENNVSQTCLKWLLDNPDKAQYSDQTALNTVLRGRILYLPDRYNANYSLYAKMQDRDEVVHSEWADEARQDPVIIHYTGKKPWIDCGVSWFPPLRNRFHYYRKLPPKTILDKRPDEPNKFRRKLYNYLYQIGLTKRMPAYMADLYGLDPRVK